MSSTRKLPCRAARGPRSVGLYTRSRLRCCRLRSMLSGPSSVTPFCEDRKSYFMPPKSSGCEINGVCTANFAAIWKVHKKREIQKAGWASCAACGWNS
eukprot:1158160-Pelagomonas_calceolata.AAC.3